MWKPALTAAAVTLLGTGTALAESDCTVPEAQRQPMAALLEKLEGEGLAVRSIELDDGCYEVDVIDAEGRRLEQAYDPQSFAMLSTEYDEGEDDGDGDEDEDE